MLEPSSHDLLTSSSLVSASGALRGSGNHLHVPSINGDADESESDDSASGGANSGFSGHLRVRRHRSLPSPTFTTEKLLASNFPQQRSNSFRLPVRKSSNVSKYFENSFKVNFVYQFHRAIERL